MLHASPLFDDLTQNGAPLYSSPTISRPRITLKPRQVLTRISNYGEMLRADLESHDTHSIPTSNSTPPCSSVPFPPRDSNPFQCATASGSPSPSPPRNESYFHNFDLFQSLEEVWDEHPGPFALTKRLQCGAFGEAVAVRELNHSWSCQQSEGRVLCLKVFRKATLRQHKHTMFAMQELKAYQTLSSSDRVKGRAFVMDLDGSLEDEDCIYFAMVRILTF